MLAWGNNSSGQLGLGNTANQSTPVVVPTLVNVNGIAVGSDHSLAITSDGAAWAWGNNSSGQLGIGNTSNQSIPVQVRTSTTSFLTSVAAVTAAGSTSFALTSDGSVWAWGVNTTGQLGINSLATQLFAVRVHGVGNTGFLTGVSTIAEIGGSAFALQLDGTVLAWGQNAGGQLGDGTTTQRLTPVQVSGLGSGSGVVVIAGIAGGGAVLKADGTVLAWGLNGSGQIGDDTATQRLTPVQVSGLGSGSGVIGIAGGGSVGAGHTLALKSDGTVLSWGGNGSGQLGDGSLSPHLIPSPVPGLGSGSGVIAVAAGLSHSLALTSDGTVLSWGANASGQLGDGTVYTRNLTPSNVRFDDVTSPAFSSIHVSPSLVGAAAQVTLTKTVSDADSGVSVVTASARSGAFVWERRHHRVDSCVGTAFSGVWSGTFTFPADAPDGTCTMMDSAVDAAENASTVTDGTITLDRTPPVVSVSSSRATLWPPNGKMVPVIVSGTIADTGSGVKVSSVAYSVTDEYGSVQPHGSVALGTNGRYTFTLELEASRHGDDRDGRQYVISVSAQDKAENNGASVP